MDELLNDSKYIGIACILCKIFTILGDMNSNSFEAKILDSWQRVSILHKFPSQSHHPSSANASIICFWNYDKI